MKKKLIGYIIQSKNNFGTWAYNGYGLFYIAKEYKIFDNYDNETGYDYEQLKNGVLTFEQAEKIYKNNCIFRGRSVKFLDKYPEKIFGKNN